MVREPTSPMEAVARGIRSSMEGGRVIGKIRTEEDQEKERDIDKEIDPSAFLMDTTMFDETNPIMEWLNEDVDDPIIDGADAASAVFEKIRRLNSSRKSSYVGSNNK